MFGPATTTGVTAAFGARVRVLRHQRGLTLKALGRKAGLSHPFLSQLERGLARPSVGSAERIAHALEVPVGTLWTEPVRRERAELVRRDDGRAVSHHDPSAPGGRRRLAAHVREWTGGSRDWPEHAEIALGEVLVYVVRGGVEVDLDGEVHALEEGDALLFDGSVPHRLRRTGGTATRALCVAAPIN